MSSYIVYRKVSGNERVNIGDLILAKQKDNDLAVVVPHRMGFIVNSQIESSKQLVGMPAQALEDPDDRPPKKKPAVGLILWMLIHIAAILLCGWLLILKADAQPVIENRWCLVVGIVWLSVRVGALSAGRCHE